MTDIHTAVAVSPVALFNGCSATVNFALRLRSPCKAASHHTDEKQTCHIHLIRVNNSNDSNNSYNNKQPSNINPMSEVESLKQQVADLAALVKKQSQLLTKTGQQVLSLQVESTKHKVSDFNPKNLSGAPRSRHQPSVDTTDFATNEDLVQLVGELQGQLEVLEERGIRRLINSQKKAGEVLAPLLNQDGEEPSFELFPGTLAEFEKLNDEDLVKLARFYELLPPTAAERAKFEEFIEGKSDSPDADVVVKPSDFSKDDLVEAYDKLARFLGLSFRRGDDAW